jgi:hypothetical protein
LSLRDEPQRSASPRTKSTLFNRLLNGCEGSPLHRAQQPEAIEDDRHVQKTAAGAAKTQRLRELGSRMKKALQANACSALEASMLELSG